MSCPSPLPGTPEIYGLGIRLSFYLLWFAIIAFNWLPRHIRGGFITLRITHLVFSFAVFISLAATISTSTSTSPQEPTETNFQAPAAETYITLLLISSTVYLLIPLYLSRVMTSCLHCCGSGCGCGIWGETDYLLVRNGNSKRARGRSSSLEGLGGAVPFLEFIFLFLAGGMQCWFWWSGVTSIDNNSECGYGFLFGRIKLDDSNFRGFNSIVVLAAMGGVVVFAGADAGIWGGSGRKRRRRKRRKSHISIAFIRELQTLFSLSVAVTLLVAIELSIQWNGISSSVDQVSTSAQLIPLLATIAVILIGILHSLTTTDDYGGGSSPSAYGSSHSGSSRVSRSEKNSSSSSGGSGPVAGRDGEVVVDWGDGNTGQSFVPPPPARPGDGFPVPPPPSPPGPAQPIPVYPPGVRTVMIEPPEDHATTSRSNSPGNSHTEASGTGESAQYENDKTSRSSEGEEDDDKDTDNNYTSDPLSPSDRGEGGAGGFGFPPPISIPLAAGPPRQKFPPPKWPPGWGQHETQRHTSPPPMGGHGFPPPPMPAFMLPFPGVVRPPPPF